MRDELAPDANIRHRPLLLEEIDKYAQERGGWKTDTIMKSVYQQTFSSERIKVDDTIDAYFENILQHECNTKKENPT